MYDYWIILIKSTLIAQIDEFSANSTPMVAQLFRIIHFYSYYNYGMFMIQLLTTKLEVTIVPRAGIIASVNLLDEIIQHFGRW